MEIEEFEDDDEEINSYKEVCLELSKNQVKGLSKSTKIKQYILDDNKSQEASNYLLKEKNINNIETEDDRNYVEMSPRKRFGRVNNKNLV